MSSVTYANAQQFCSLFFLSEEESKWEKGAKTRSRRSGSQGLWGRTSRAHRTSHLLCPLGGLFRFFLSLLLGDKRKAERWKHLWVKLCEKKRLRALATFTEEITFLWRRRPLSVWWDGGMGRERGGGMFESASDMEDGAGQRENGEATEVGPHGKDSFHPKIKTLSVSFHLYNFTF